MKDPRLYTFDDEYFRLKTDLDRWHLKLIEQVEEIFWKIFLDLDTSYERLERFRQTLDVFLDDRQSSLINTSEFLQMSSRLNWIENEIESLAKFSFEIDFDRVHFLGRPRLHQSNRSFDLQSSPIPCRILILREHLEQLTDVENKSFYTYSTHSSSPEAIIQTQNLQQLTILIEPIVSMSEELRILIQEHFVPFFDGQCGNRTRFFQEKYALNLVQIFPICAPLSTERVLLLSGPSSERIFQCFIEIYFHLSQITSIETKQKATFVYSPEFYDLSLVEDYGGFLSRQISSKNLPECQNHLNDEEELSEYEDEDVEDFDQETTIDSAETNESLRERHWTLSDAQAGALFGSNSSRLHQIRSESNAWIVIYEAEGKNSRRPMSIRGTKDEIEHATKLILETIKRHDRKLPLKQNSKRNK